MELVRVGEDRVLIPFIDGVSGISLVVVDIHYELEASHDGRQSLKLEIRDQVSNTQPCWTAPDK